MSKYNKAVADEICRRISCGESLAQICRDDHMPKQWAVFEWLKQEPGFAENYARAREASADADADAISDIAARTLSGEFDPNAARVAIDALKWTAGRRQPKKYGAKLELAGDAEAPLQVVIQKFTDK